MIDVTVFDTKPYDRQYLTQSDSAGQVRWQFVESRLSSKTAALAKNASAICIFVNDCADRECLKILASLDIRLITLRCAGFNNIDLEAAKELGMVVTRVPAYSPYAVAEHTVGLLLTLNRKIHRAYNRVRESNFSLNGLVGFDIHGKTVGIIGTGKIGRITAQIFRGFQAKVIAFDPFPSVEWARNNSVEYSTLEQLLSMSDIISLHVPLLPETTKTDQCKYPRADQEGRHSA